MARSRRKKPAPKKRRKISRAQREQATLKKLHRAVDAFRKRYGEYDNVEGISFGVASEEVKHAETDTEINWRVFSKRGTLAIIVYVKEKLSRPMLKRKGRLALPDRFRGFPVDLVSLAVVGRMPIQPTADFDDAPDLVGGIEIGVPSPGGMKRGTACLVVTKDQSAALLTCAHVINQQGASHVVQPAVDDPRKVIGKVGPFNKDVDAGLILLNDARFKLSGIIGSGQDARPVTIWDGDTATLPAKPMVSKIGAATPETPGQVLLFDVPSVPIEGSGNVGPVMMIQPQFAAKGDSGAPVFHVGPDGTNLLMGMLVGISPGFAYAVPIHRIKKELTIEL